MLNIELFDHLNLYLILKNFNAFIEPIYNMLVHFLFKNFVKIYYIKILQSIF
jgi:hypothetical protein